MDHIHEDDRFTKHDVLTNGALQAELLQLATKPHDLEDGGMYVPPRRFSPEVAANVKSMVAALDVPSVMVMLDMAMMTLYWAVDQKIRGNDIGAVDPNDEFVEADLPFLQAINPSDFERVTPG